jgi:hypothetical protein
VQVKVKSVASEDSLGADGAQKPQHTDSM